MGAGGGGGTSTPAPAYQLGSQPWADYGAVQGINSIGPTAMPYPTDILQNAYGSLGGIVGGQAGSQGYDPNAVVKTGQNVLNASQGLPNIASSVWNANQGLPNIATQIYNTAFDPQSQLFNSLQQQVIDQTNAQLAGSGLAGTPFGAGVLGQNQTNLDLGWQNNLLNRQLQGAQGIEGLLSQYGGSGQQASGILDQYGKMQQQGVGIQQSAPQMQLEMAQGLGGLANNVLSQQQQQIQDWLAYLSQGNANQQSSVSTAQEINQANAQKQQQMMQAISGIGGAAGSLMGGK